MEKSKIQFVKLGKAIEPYQEQLSYNTEYRYIKYGKSNDYDKFLINLSKKSPIHSGILSRKRKMDIGDGLKWDENIQKLNDFYKGLDKDFYNDIFGSIELFGGVFIGVKWYKNEIIGLEYIPFEYCRLGEPDENDKIPYILMSKNWKKEREEKYRPVPFPVFTGKKQDDYEIAFIASYSEGQYYPTPAYEAAINMIESDFEISKFSLANIKNQFSPGTMIVFTDGLRTPQEEESMIYEIESKKGAEGAGNYLVYFTDDATKAPIINTIPASDLDKQYQILSETIDNKVITAHEIPRILANVETPGSLGDSKQMLEARENFLNDYIKYQRALVIDFFNEINLINGLDTKIEFVTARTINFTILELYKEFFTREEVREFLGLKNDTPTISPIAPTTEEQNINKENGIQ